MANSINQQSEPDSKRKAIFSLILGLISLILGLFPLLFLFLGMNPMAPSRILNIVFLLPITILVGLIFGIMGLKSTKRNFAIIGIVLSVIGLLVPLYYFLF